MEFAGFDWDAGNIEKCRKHGVSMGEIESLFHGTPLVDPDAAHSRAEQRYRAIGKTSESRSIFVVFTWRVRRGERL